MAPPLDWESDKTLTKHIQLSQPKVSDAIITHDLAKSPSSITDTITRSSADGSHPLPHASFFILQLLHTRRFARLDGDLTALREEDSRGVCFVLVGDCVDVSCGHRISVNLGDQRFTARLMCDMQNVPLGTCHMPPLLIAKRVPATSTDTFPDATKNMKWNFREFLRPLLPPGGSSIMPLPKKSVVRSFVKRKVGLSGAARGVILAPENAMTAIKSQCLS